MKSQLRVEICCTNKLLNKISQMLIEVSAKTWRISLGTNCHQELFKGLDNINSGFNLTICRLYKI
jgi:hypothetical protein